MAALIRHGMQKGRGKINTCENILMSMTRNKSTIVKPSYKLRYNQKKEPPPSVQLDSMGESIANKGFHRSQKAYSPPQDVADRIGVLYKSITGSLNSSEMPLSNPEVKFKVLNACFQEFQHSVPNALLSKMLTIDDILEFYKTPVLKSSPLESLKTMKLPENLHVQLDYVRFHPETDTMFKGVTAFPRRSTIVTGLRAKKKYKGYEIKTPW